MKRVIFVLLILMSVASVYSGTAGKTYMPFNPVEKSAAGDVSEYFFWDVGGRVKLNHTYLVLEKQSSDIAVAGEVYNRTGYGELFELSLPAGRISVHTYLNEFLGINIGASEEIITKKVSYSDCSMDNSGNISPENRGSTQYHLLQFEVNGSKVPFVDNPEVKVVALIFLDSTIPLIGIKNAKFFTMINYNGKWLRTNGTDVIEFRHQGSFDSKQLLKDRPWTQLTQYLIAEDTSEDYSGTGMAYSDLKEGMFVLAREKGYWCPATVSSLRNKRVYILFIDGELNDIFDNSSFPVENLKPFFWKQGTKISARMSSSRKWLGATVWDIDYEDEQLKIFVDDGDIPMWVSLGDCRQTATSGEEAPREESPPEEMDDSSYYDPFSGYDDSYPESDEGFEEMMNELYNTMEEY